MILVSVLVAFVVYLILSYLLKKGDSDKFPPGPPGLPIVGNFFSLKPNLYLANVRFGKTYGDVFTIDRFSMKMVVLNSYKAIKEALVDNANTFAVRPELKNVRFGKKDGGIILTNGAHWQDHRRFALKTLRDFGFAKNISVNAVHVELHDFIDDMIKRSGRPIETKIPFATLTTNVICRMVFGQRLSEDEDKCNDLLKKLTYCLQSSGLLKNNILLVFPSIGYIPFFKFFYAKYNRRVKCLNAIFDYMHDQIRQHSKTIGEITEPRDFTDALILHRMALQKEGGGESFDEEFMELDMFDLFLAGTDTTSVTLSWGMLLMSTHPEVQKKTRAEIHEVLGSESLPAMQDQLKLNYTLAVIDEISRYSTIVPSSVIHSCSQDVVICGRKIPKDSAVLPNLYAVHHEAGLWKHPETFNPENFLDDKGNYKASEYLIQFSLGKRSCLGESLARMEVFIFFVGIMQKFRVSLANQENVDLENLFINTGEGIRHLDSHEIIFHQDS